MYTKKELKEIEKIINELMKLNIFIKINLLNNYFYEKVLNYYNFQEINKTFKLYISNISLSELKLLRDLYIEN